MGLRRKSRELALQFLFGHDFQQNTFDPETVSEELIRFGQCFEASQKALPYAEKLLAGICRHLEEIDLQVSSHSHNWRIERMSLVDRNILRIAIYEMRYSEEVPERVAINEALEIAKRYSMGDSLAFINGVLDSVQAASVSKAD